MQVHQTYERLTLPRVRVLALLAEGKTISQIAKALGYSYNGARSHIRDLERILDCSGVDEVRAWWDRHGEAWLAYVARRARLVRGRNSDLGS